MKYKSLNKLTPIPILLLILIHFQSCSDVDFAPIASNSSEVINEIETFSTKLQFTQPPLNYNGKVDILFVIDTSGSLDNERGQIADNIDLFISQLPAQSDYNIAVLLAHSTLSSYSGKLYKKPNQNRYVLESSQMSISSIRSDLRVKITDTDRVQNTSDLPSDSASDGGEEGLAALNNLLTPENIQLAQSRNFLRSDAALAVVFVSDENDICAIYPSGVTRVPDAQHTNGIEAELFAKDRDCTNVTATSVFTKLRALKMNLPLRVTGVIYTNPETTPLSGENEVGYGYTDIINLSQGLAVDIGGNIALGLASIGQLVTNSMMLLTEFNLIQSDIIDCERQVIANSIQVTVDTVPNVPFTFLTSNCKVSLTAATAGGPSSNITIDFDYIK